MASLVFGIAWIAGALRDKIIISTPNLSIKANRFSWMSKRRDFNSGHIFSAKYPWESIIVASVAKCSSSPILPFITLSFLI